MRFAVAALSISTRCPMYSRVAYHIALMNFHSCETFLLSIRYLNLHALNTYLFILMKHLGIADLKHGHMFISEFFQEKKNF